MVYFKGILSGVTAVFLTLSVPGLVHAFRGISQEKATGVAVVWGGLIEAAFSLRFWAVAVALFSLLFVASRLNSKALRVSLFWIPTLFVSIMAVGVTVLVSYWRLRSR